MYRIVLVKLNTGRAKAFASILRNAGIAQFVYDDTCAYDSLFGNDIHDWEYVTASENLHHFIVEQAKHWNYEYRDHSDNLLPASLMLILDRWFTVDSQDGRDELDSNLTQMIRENRCDECQDWKIDGGCVNPRCPC